MLSYEERSALESLAVGGDTVVDAAFNVAVKCQDIDYLAALFKDVAASRLDSSQVRIIDHGVYHPRVIGFVASGSRHQGVMFTRGGVIFAP